MPLTAGTRLGSYEVLAPLGAGGMGEVYRARDTRLKRDVALKVLPSSFAADADRLARFQREAELLASLNHPHIAHVHGIEEADGTRALVMELVDGESLAGRIARGPIPLDDAIALARQIADALEAAHERGIVHRDLKPANIMVTPEQQVKVLDFGLAKDIGPASQAGRARQAGGDDVTNSPTITSPARLRQGYGEAGTEVGLILGTAAYMAPEQAKGRPVGKRADIWAFGCVLFEMLTGRRAFEGESVTETLANILKTDPDWARLPPDVPASLRSLLEGCLEKDPGRRVSDIAVATFLLGQPQSANAPSSQPTRGTHRARRTSWRIALVALAGAAAGAIVAAAVFRRPVPPTTVAPLGRFGLMTSPGTAFGRTGGDRDLAVSATGTHIAYIGANGDMFLRALDQFDAVPVAGLRGSRGPFFSPDGQWLGFFDAGGFLKKIAISGGAAITICQMDASGSRGAAWLDDGTIVFATNKNTGLWRVPASGGTPAVLTTPDPATEADHLWPHAVPGRHAVLFTAAPAQGTQGSARTMMLDLESHGTSVLMEGASDAHYLASGYLVYVVPGLPLASTLQAVAFDLARAMPGGRSIPIAPVTAAATYGADFDVAANGTLVYSPTNSHGGARTLVWVDRSGREEPINAPPRAYFYPRISPDFSRVALDARDEDSDIWVWEFARQTLTRVTTDPLPDRFPVWMRDGQTLLYTSAREGHPNVYRKRVDATTPPERITSGVDTQAPMSVTPTGTHAIVRESTPTAHLMLLSLTGDPTLKPLIKTTFTEQNGEVSPDGRWMAYESNESGQFEIYVRPFPDVDRARWQISNGGGTQPLWSRDGTELFFNTPSPRGGPLRSMSVVRVERGADWRHSPQQALPGVNTFGTGNPIGGEARTYDIGPDGRFLMVKGAEGDTGSITAGGSFQLVVVMNWVEDLKRLAAK